MSRTPSDDRLAGVLAFLRAAEALKVRHRSGRTSDGAPESIAAHSWRLALAAIVLGDALGEHDRLRLLELCVLHDLGEAISGDVPAIHQRPDDGRAARERADLETLGAPLPAEIRARLLALHDEYEAGATREAVLAKALDKIETILQHLQGDNGPDFDHGFNLGYARARTDADPVTARLRAMLDKETRAHVRAADPAGRGASSPAAPPR
ncbi:HD domain-containing protein [Salinarimonas sp. NSM]|uniref:HD domain-containing protein n=1 Tax=Salinarimonas sp. NSM TaxID=3458003 RepID=UPI00403612AF